MSLRYTSSLTRNQRISAFAPRTRSICAHSDETRRRRRMATFVFADEAWRQMHGTEQKVLTSEENVGFYYTKLAIGRYNHQVHKAWAVLV